MCIKSLPILINTYSICFDVPHCPAQCFASPSLTRRSTKRRLRLQLDSVMGSRRALANITQIYADIIFIYDIYIMFYLYILYIYIYTYTWNRMNLWTHHSPSNMFRFPGNPTLECRAHAWKCLPRSASGVAANGERINVLSYLTQSETRALDATCFDVCLWTEIHARKWLQIPMVESDVEKAAWYRLWGHYYWLSWLPWKLGSSLHRSVLGCKQHVAQFYLLGLLDMLPLPRRWPWLALSAPHCRSQVQLPCLRILRQNWNRISTA